MKLFLIGMVALLFVGCATSTHQTDSLVKKHSGLPAKAQIKEVPFIKQAKNLCGPSTMAMVLKHAGKEANLDELTSQMFTKGMEGTFQTEMLTAARRAGMLALPITDMSSLLHEIAAGHPVIVFQNLGFGFYPIWHYAVALGYDLDGPDMILHSGSDKFDDGDMRMFERSWKLGGNWGLLVLRPEELGASVNEVTHALAAAALEQLGDNQNAETAYKSILKKWPSSLGALIGLGNTYYTRKDYQGSAQYLRKAVKLHPHSSAAKQNLEHVQKLIIKN